MFAGMGEQADAQFQNERPSLGAWLRAQLRPENAVGFVEDKLCMAPLALFAVGGLWGGLLGGAIGIVAWRINLRVMAGAETPPRRYLKVAFISAGASVVHMHVRLLLGLPT